MLSRRDIFGSVAGLFGFGATKETKKEEKAYIITFHIDVGCLPPLKAQAFIERQKAEFLASHESKRHEFPYKCMFFFVPNRCQGSRVEITCCDGQGVADAATQIPTLPSSKIRLKSVNASKIVLN